MSEFHLPESLTPPQRLLMGPGPSAIDPRVLAALNLPTVGHLDPFFLKTMDEMQRMLRQVFRTENELTLAVSGTGRVFFTVHPEARMEAFGPVREALGLDDYASARRASPVD